MKARVKRSAGTRYSAPSFRDPASRRRTVGAEDVAARREASAEPAGPAEIC